MKDIKFGREVRNLIFEGIKKAAEAVTVTLGPRGRNVILERDFSYPLSTKDGVTVAREISLKDKFENIGASLIKEAASKANILVGDGTTTTTALIYSLIKEGELKIAFGLYPTDIKKGIEDAIQIVLTKIDEMKKDVSTRDDILNTATISANNDKEIGEVITEAFDNLGPNGVITIAESKTNQTYIDFIEGMQFDRGYLSSYFTTQKGAFDVENPLIIIFDYEVKDFTEYSTLIQKLNLVKKPILIIVPEISSEFITNFATINYNNPSQKLCVVKAPGFGNNQIDLLNDIAIFTGATIITKNFSNNTVSNFELNWAGKCKRILTTAYTTTIFEGGGDPEKIKNRVEELKEQLNTEMSSFIKESLRERIAKLDGGIAIIRVGALTELALKEKKQRYEDALSATRAAITGGILPGGGIALLKIAEELEIPESNNTSYKAGFEIVKSALQYPFQKIIENSGKNADIIKYNILKNKKDKFYGYDVLNERYGNMYDLGIIDPAAVTKSAIKLATDIAGMALITECVIVNDSNIRSYKNDPDVFENFI